MFTQFNFLPETVNPKVKTSARVSIDRFERNSLYSCCSDSEAVLIVSWIDC